MGALVYRRIRDSVRTEKVLFFGYTDVKFFSAPFVGFMKTAIGDGLKIKTVIEVADGVSANSLKDLGPTLNVNWITVDAAKLAQILQDQKMKQQPLVVIVPAEQATHLEKSGLVKQMEGELKSPIMAINFLPFYVDEKEITEEMTDDCAKPQNEMLAREKLQCASYKVSRKFLRKKLDETKLFVALEWHGLKEYLAYLHTP